jgi:hypothetical protein
LLGRSYDSCWVHYLTWRSSCSSQACIISMLADIYMWDGAIFKGLSSGRDFSYFGAVFLSVEVVSSLWIDQLPDLRITLHLDCCSLIIFHCCNIYLPPGLSISYLLSVHSSTYRSESILLFVVVIGKQLVVYLIDVTTNTRINNSQTYHIYCC